MRRGTFTSSHTTRNPYLPITEEDVLRRLLHPQKTRILMRKRRKLMERWRSKVQRIPPPLFSVLVYCGVFVLTCYLWKNRFTLSLRSREVHMRNGTDNHPRHPQLQQEFASLQYALAHSDLVALYFAASWCPMSTTSSEQLEMHLNHLLVLPPHSPLVREAEAQQQQQQQQQPRLQHQYHRHNSTDNGLALVYVSSDHSEEQMLSYLNQHSNWMHVPFDSPDRAALKRYFATAAKIEMEELGMDQREHEIPTLVVVDSQSRQVVTFAGINELYEYGAEVILHWRGLTKS